MIRALKPDIALADFGIGEQTALWLLVEVANAGRPSADHHPDDA